MCVNLVLLARGTSMDICANIGCKAQPPKFRGNELASFENSWMTGSGVVMVAGNNGMAKCSIIWHVDLVLISQDTSIIVPVGEA